ncbi:MAG: UDP-2,3-diacylglucosamine diphosphatase, partial [Bacteroidetes bacterium]
RLVQFCEDEISRSEVDYFVFGHRHLPIDYTLKNGHSRYINLGDWLVYNSYAVFDGNDLQVKFFENADARVFGN